MHDEVVEGGIAIGNSALICWYQFLDKYDQIDWKIDELENIFV